jgi:hypothetical protein
VEGILTPLALLMPAFSLPAAPRSLMRSLHCNRNALLPIAPSADGSIPQLRRLA